METMLNVTVNGTIHQYPYGTTYRAIAAEFQENYPHQILLVNRDGKLRELQKTVKRDCSLSMVTAADKPGRQTYERSAILLMLKAFYDVVGREQVEHVRVEFSQSNALFCRARGSFTLDNTLLHRIEDRAIGFVEFQELKYAIEALGGEYNEPRDFSDDKDYLRIEDVSSREGFSKGLPRS